MSRFDFDMFIDNDEDIDYIAINKQKYSKDEAYMIAKRELGSEEGSDLIFEEEIKYITYGFVTTIDGEKENGYYLDDIKRKTSVECWVWREQI